MRLLIKTFMEVVGVLMPVFRLGEVGVYASLVMALILVTYVSLYVNSLHNMSYQQQYITENQQIESLRRAENILFKYVAGENAIYATSTITTTIKTIVIYDSVDVVYSSVVNIKLDPSSWVKIVEGGLAKLITEDNHVLGVITENGNLVTWVQQEASNLLSAVLLPAVRYQSFRNGYPRYVSLVTSTSPPNELLCSVSPDAECVGTVNVTFPNERKTVINAPALYADLIGVYVWVRKTVNITLKIIFAENNFNVPVNITFYYLLLPPNSRVEDLITYRCHVNYSTHTTQPLKKVVIKEYFRKSVLVDVVSFSINEPVILTGTLVVLAFTITLPPGRYPENPTIVLDLEVVAVR
ncbi:MAG: hypothetical protein QN229_05960 [Desulfurococcaceae archaeon TW002]